ncbi:MAG: LuxR C-terminal-related transcriptional regulator [Anaerolineae bacterium]
MTTRSQRPTSDAPTIRLLRTKLFVPQAHPDLVERERLIRRLDESRRCRLVLISAPAGFGKTTLLSSWIAKRQLPVAWVSLDQDDNDPSRFWAYIIAALQTLWPEVGASALALLRSPQSPPIESILTELLNDLVTRGLDRGVFLVLDDYHAIDQPGIHGALDFLVDHLPPQLHLIISSRVDPPLSLSLLRGRRQLAEIRATDLRFTLEEAAAFLDRTIGPVLDAKDAKTLEAITEGWAAGLQLAALSLQEVEDVDAFLTSFSGSHRYVFDYLAQEVLHHQTSAVREFLLRSAVLGRMSGSLCDAIMERDDSRARLVDLERANLFLVPLDHERRWYRYHHLFVDFLRARLEETATPEEIAALHRRASVWYAARDQSAEAIRHALAAGDTDRAVELIENAVPEMFRTSELTTLIGWLNALPEALVRRRPYLSMVMAWAKLALGRSEDIDQHLRDVEQAIGARAGESAASLEYDADTRGALAEISCIRASVAFNRMDVNAVKSLTDQAMRYLSGDTADGLFNTRLALEGVAAFNRALALEFGGDTREAVEAFEVAIRLQREDNNLHLLPMSMSHLAQLQMVLGDLHTAAQTYQAALRMAESGGIPSPLSGIAYTGLGSLLYEWNRLKQAKEALSRGLEMGRAWFQWEIMLTGTAGLAHIDLAEGHPSQAIARLEALAALTRERDMLWAEPMVEAYIALCQARQGDLSAADRWLEATPLHPDQPVSFADESYAMFYARVLLMVGHGEMSCRWAERIIERAEAGERWGHAVQGWVLHALSSQALGRRAEAVASLERALRLAEPGDYVRTFVDAGPVMAELLADVGILPAYVDRLLTAFKSSTPISEPDVEHPPAEADESGAPGLVEPLTDRELEVLNAIADGMTNKQIADRLYISVNTVKTHVKHIYEKLNVRNRAQAVTRASELDLL